MLLYKLTVQHRAPLVTQSHTLMRRYLVQSIPLLFLVVLLTTHGLVRAHVRTLAPLVSFKFIVAAWNGSTAPVAGWQETCSSDSRILYPGPCFIWPGSECVYLVVVLGCVGAPKTKGSA